MEALKTRLQARSLRLHGFGTVAHLPEPGLLRPANDIKGGSSRCAYERNPDDLWLLLRTWHHLLVCSTRSVTMLAVLCMVAALQCGSQPLQQTTGNFSSQGGHLRPDGDLLHVRIISC